MQARAAGPVPPSATFAHRGVMKPPLVIPSGEPAGIGPDLCALLAAGDAPARFNAHLVILGDRNLIVERAPAHGVDASRLSIENITLRIRACAGQLNNANMPSVLALLVPAIDGL